MDPNPSIDRILSSKTFQNKEVLKGLLRFIHQESLNGKLMKEADIASGFFKRGNDFIPGEDTIVRVNVYKLRNLLEKYYQDEGIAETVIVEIPKGKYCLSTRNKALESSVSASRAKHRWPQLIFLLLFLSVIINLVFLYLNIHQSGSNSINPVWKSYVEAAKPVYITLGDPFFFRIKNVNYPSGSLIARDISINSKEDLEINVKKRAGGSADISNLNYPYFSRNNLWPLPNIISTFAKASVETRLQTLSEATIDDIKTNNVIFIANINSFGWMNEFLKKTSLRLYTNPRKIIVKRGNDSLSLTVPEYVKGKYEDYAFLVKLPGGNGNIITLMGDFHPSGLRGLSTFLSGTKTLNNLTALAEKQYGRFPEYFEMLVKVTSYNYADFDTQLVLFKSLE